MNTIPKVSAEEPTEAEENKYLFLILNPDKRKSTRAFIRQGGNRRQDHGTKGWMSGRSRRTNRRFFDYGWRGAEDEAQLLTKRKNFRAAGRQISGRM